MTHVPFIGPDPHTPEWYAWRVFDEDRAIPVCFGASEAAAVCGLGNHDTKLHVYMKKRGLLEDDNKNADAKAFGRFVEPAIIELYKWKTGRSSIKAPCSLYFHPQYRYISATPDGIVLDSLGEWMFPIDCKATTLRRFAYEFGAEETDQLPDEIVMQAQQQMLVLGLDSQETVVMVDRTIKIFRVERSEELCNTIIECCTEMYYRVIDGDPPDPDVENVTTGRLLKGLYPVTGEVVDASPELIEVWEQRREIGKKISDLTKQKERLSTIVLADMKDNGAAAMPDGRMIVRSVVKREAYTVDASEYIQLREVKPKKKGR